MIRKERLASLFVCKDCHRRGIGRSLVERFEQENSRKIIESGEEPIKLDYNIL
jgi:GNAT superfamily N-acetyltransferase